MGGVWRAGAGAVLAALVLGACDSRTVTAPTNARSVSPRVSPSVSPSTTPGTSSAPAGTTVWLCRPGLANNPCTADLTSTAVSANGARSVENAPTANPPVDCFYVYPTVSAQRTANANLHVDPEETAVAVAQASRFSQACRVFAPMYPQLTLSAIGVGGARINAQAAITAYLGVRAAWRDYLAHDNHGRGVVLIGHSQGASMLIALLRNEIDPNASVRRRMVSALLLGGNVAVPIGKDVGGDFAHIPACRSGRQTGCVVAYSSFDAMPPANSYFGRIGTSIATTSGLGRRSTAGLHVLCTNPAELAGDGEALRPYFPTNRSPGRAGSLPGVTTPWVSFPLQYRASCRSAEGADWLQVTDIIARGDRRPVVTATLGPRWGLHLVDVNIALGNLVTLVENQARAYTR